MRWLNNLVITFLNPLVVRLIFPVLAVDMALRAQERDWGLLNNFDLPYWLDIVVGIIDIRDSFKWGSHVQSR